MRSLASLRRVRCLAHTRQASGAAAATPGGGGDGADERTQRPGPLEALRWRLSALWGAAAVHIVRSAVDRGFDEAAFLDGASDAFHAVHELAWARERPQGWKQSLAELTSPPVAKAFAETADEYAAQGLRPEMEIRALRSCHVTGGSLLTSAELGDAPQPAEGGRDGAPPAAGPLHLALRVRFESSDVFRLFGLSDGKLVGEQRSDRGHEWRFARALPRELPADSVETPWRLVDVR